LNIGNLALRLSRQVASDCEINELLLAACPEELRRQSKTFIFPHEPVMSELPTMEVLMGSVIAKYFEHVARQDESVGVSEQQLASIIHQGFTHAFLLNTTSAGRFMYRSVSMLLSFEQKSVSSDAIRIFRLLESLPSSVYPEKGELQMNSTTSFQFVMTLDKNGDTESFVLELQEECLALPICRLWGDLTSSSSEHFNVQGFRVANLVHLELPFRKAKLLMGGVRDDNDDLFLRFVAVGLDHSLSQSSEMFAIDPDVGDTGTGTANQTALNEGNLSR
jgi:hypothetical protein